MARIVVIGGGIGGLAAAARLSIKGHEVTVVERSKRLGGLVQNFSHGGFTFGLGPNKLTLPAVYRDLFLKTGASLEDSVELVEIPDGTRYHWSEGTSVLVPSVGGTTIARALDSSLGGTAGADWRELTKRAGEMWKIVRPKLLERQLTSTDDLKQVTSDRQTRKTLAPRSSLSKLTKKVIKDKRVRQLVESYALSQGADPRSAPATLLTEPYIEQTFGTWWITGGIHALIDALEARCVERKVELRTKACVQEILLSDGRVTGISLTDGSIVETDIVVFGGSTRTLTRLCTDPQLAAVTGLAKKSALTNSVFTILAAVQGTTEDIAHENVYLSPESNRELKQLERSELPTEPTIRIFIPQDSTMSPPGHEAWTIQVTVPLHKSADNQAQHAGIDWVEPDVAQNYAELILDQLGKRGAKIRDRLLWHEIRTPADIEAELNIPGGSVFGPTPYGWQDTWLKPTVRTPIEGLYLVGDSVQPGTGLDRVGMGAEILADTIGRAKSRGKLRTKRPAQGPKRN